MQVDCEGAGRAAFGGELRVGVAQVRGDTEAQARRAHRRLERPVVAAPFGAMATAPNAYGVGDMPIDWLSLTQGLIERALAERGDAPPAYPKGRTE